jgi:hypothetical protein
MFPPFVVVVKEELNFPTTIEGWLLIRFLSAKNVCPAEIHMQIVLVNGEGAMKEGNVRKWCLLFKESMKMHN